MFEVQYILNYHIEISCLKLFTETFVEVGKLLLTKSISFLVVLSVVFCFFEDRQNECTILDNAICLKEHEDSTELCRVATTGFPPIQKNLENEIIFPVKDCRKVF